MKVAVIGANGQLGTEICEVLLNEGHQVVPLSHSEIEIADPESVRSALSSRPLEAVVNCAALHQFDACEADPAKALRVNALGALNAARACREINALCVYISTDYVFSGEKKSPYFEDDPPAPLNVYGATKASGEFLTRQSRAQWIIVRTASVFGKTGPRGKGKNFVDTMIERARKGEQLKVVNDITMSPSYAVDVAKGIEHLLKERKQGIFHLANQGECTWYEFAAETLKIMNIRADIEAVSSTAFPSKAPRPKYSALGARRPDSPKLRSWKEAIGDYLAVMKH